MDEQIIAINCLCYDLLRAPRDHEDAHRALNDAEVMTTAIVAAVYFGRSFEILEVCSQPHNTFPRYWEIGASIVGCLGSNRGFHSVLTR